MMDSARSFPRICILIERYHPAVGGTEEQARNLARALKERGVPLFFITRRSGSDMPRRGEVDGIPVYRVPPAGRSARTRWLLAMACIPQLIKRRKDYDIVLVHSFRSLGYPVVALSRMLGKKCVLKAETPGEMSGAFFDTGLEGMKLRSSSFFVRRLIACRNRKLARADRFISMSSEITAELTEHGVPAERIVSIPNAIDATRFTPLPAEEKPALRDRLSLPRDQRIAVYTGRLVSYKGLPALLRVWKSLCETDKNSHLVLVGAGSEDMANCEEDLRRYAEAEGMNERVTFTGRVDNVEEYLSSADLFVFPTENEAFGLSLVEAMACALPSVATAVGGIKDILSDGETGIVVERGNEERLRNGIISLLNDPSLRARYGTRAREVALERYTVDTVAGQYVELFRAMQGTGENAA
jgi:glycosyltransferase involved in cell wall biosynthesis